MHNLAKLAPRVQRVLISNNLSNKLYHNPYRVTREAHVMRKYPMLAPPAQVRSPDQKTVTVELELGFVPYGRLLLGLAP